MNRATRNQLARNIRKAVSAIRQEGYELGKAIENIKDDEEGKLANMPYSFSNSSIAMNMEEELENLISALDILTSGLETIDEVANILGVSVNYTPSDRKHEKMLSEGARGVRFPTLLPKAMMEELKRVSSYTGASKNEIVCRALKHYLSTESKP